jgi:hypothetical protein
MKLCVSIQQYNYAHCVWLKKTTTKKAKHGAGACRSQVYVYYDEFKVIFLMLLVGLELRISGLHVLRLTH